ncbi:MAG: hypothetical protein HYX91_05805 [Chloroflexi bacterium]|nr:hypothetical protein [Chloroflexota bacterium]
MVFFPSGLWDRLNWGKNNEGSEEMNNLSFASLAYDNKKKKSRREKILQEMDIYLPPRSGTNLLYLLIRVSQVRDLHGLPSLENLKLKTLESA